MKTIEVDGLLFCVGIYRDSDIEVTRAGDGYPLGRLVCITHESLSPIRKRATL